MDLNNNLEFEIVKRVDGYYVISESGKNLGGPYKTKKEAEKRLKQVEWFKKKKKFDAKDKIIENMNKILKNE